MECGSAIESARMGACESCARVCVEPIAPCLLGGCVTGCDGRVRWRGEPGDGRIALTIDDVPRRGSTQVDVNRLLVKLAAADGAKATFFVIWSEGKHFDGDVVTMVETLSREGHEIGVHFDGRWGCLADNKRLGQEALEAVNALQRITGSAPRYARLPGGFSRPSTVSMLAELHLTVVNGTAYPFDVDLCACLGPRALGRAAANLGRDGGRIAILHDRADLIPKIEAFLEHAKRNDCQVVSLDTLLDEIPATHTRPILPMLRL